jgi:hypothetical protein
MAGDLARRSVGLGLVAEDERAEAERSQVAAAEGQRGGIVVAGDPDPVAPGHEGGEAGRVVIADSLAGGAVVEAVAEADDDGRRQRRDLVGEAVEGLGSLVGRKQRAAAAGQPLGLAKVEVGDAEQPLVGPPERKYRSWAPSRATISTRARRPDSPAARR